MLHGVSCLWLIKLVYTPPTKHRRPMPIQKFTYFPHHYCPPRTTLPLIIFCNTGSMHPAMFLWWTQQPISQTQFWRFCCPKQLCCMIWQMQPCGKLQEILSEHAQLHRIWKKCLASTGILQGILGTFSGLALLHWYFGLHETAWVASAVELAVVGPKFPHCLEQSLLPCFSMWEQPVS